MLKSQSTKQIAYVFNARQNWRRVRSDCRRLDGRLFHIRGPAAGNARSPRCVNRNQFFLLDYFCRFRRPAEADSEGGGRLPRKLSATWAQLCAAPKTRGEVRRNSRTNGCSEKSTSLCKIPTRLQRCTQSVPTLTGGSAEASITIFSIYIFLYL